MSPMRRDAEGRRQIAPAWESLVERQIREAVEAGDFDELPFRGQKIPIDDEGGEWALAHHVLRQAGVAPIWIETDKEIRELLARRDSILARAPRSAGTGPARDRAEVARLVEQVNRLVFRLNHDAPTTRQHRRPLDLDEELVRLARAQAGERERPR